MYIYNKRFNEKIKNRSNIIYIIITWNHTKSILLILSQPRLLIFLLCECPLCLKNIQLYIVIEFYKVINYIHYTIRCAIPS